MKLLFITNCPRCVYCSWSSSGGKMSKCSINVNIILKVFSHWTWKDKSPITSPCDFWFVRVDSRYMWFIIYSDTEWHCLIILIFFRCWWTNSWLWWNVSTTILVLLAILTILSNALGTTVILINSGMFLNTSATSICLMITFTMYNAHVNWPLRMFWYYYVDCSSRIDESVYDNGSSYEYCLGHD